MSNQQIYEEATGPQEEQRPNFIEAAYEGIPDSLLKPKDTCDATNDD